MADTSVTLLRDYLSELLAREVYVLDGVENQVESLYFHLCRLIDSLLENSQGKWRLAREEVQKIREAEDLIDTFILDNVEEDKRTNRVRNVFNYSFNHADTLRIAIKIEAISNEIKQIYNNRKNYNIERAKAILDAWEEEELHSRRREVKADDVVGFDHDSMTLVEQLTQEINPGLSKKNNNNNNLGLHVLSIIGMGGLGKTTLAKKIYSNDHVNKHFDCRVWVYVSQDFTVKKLLVKLLESISHKDEMTEELEDMSVEALKEKFSKSLDAMRYLVVLDDVWRPEVWYKVRSAFPDNSNGSRILITSRITEVALRASHTPPYFLRFLNKDESLELFNKKVFGEGRCPPELETLGRQIAESCHGLPLSIVVLAGILAKEEKSHHIWSKYVGHVTRFLIREEDTAICKKTLFLSYTDLPRRLKPCFLYFGIFPEDFEIPVRQLMQLWVAEGFIRHMFNDRDRFGVALYLKELFFGYHDHFVRENFEVLDYVNELFIGGPYRYRNRDRDRDRVFGEFLEELIDRDRDQNRDRDRNLDLDRLVEEYLDELKGLDQDVLAEKYLEELIGRGLIQVASRRTNGTVKTCRIHALLRDICILESVEEEFLEVPSGGNRSLVNKSNRLSIQCSIDQFLLSNRSNRSRSLLFLRQDTYVFDPNHWKWVLKSFKLLRVLNFGLVNLYCIPTGIENLFFLRYLAIESDALRVLPTSIGNLMNLETLDMRGTFLDCLPQGIWKLRSLRNLYMSGPVSLPNDFNPDDVETLPNLRVLSTVLLNPKLNSKLPNVWKLGIWFASDESIIEVADVLKSLIHLPRLQTLKIINYSEHPLQNSFPSTITKITLRQVWFSGDLGMRELGKLPNLKILKLQSCMLSGELSVFADSFPRLGVLKLENLRIKEWKQEECAMPRLRHLIIKQCVLLTMVPQQLLNLFALRDVEVLWSNQKLAKMLEELQVLVGFKLLIDPPLDADFYKQTAA